MPDVGLVVLAAGLGKRLWPLTDSVPKALVRVCGVRILDWILAQGRATHIAEVCVTASTHADQIQRAITEGGHEHVTLAVEDAPLGAAGSMANTRDWWSRFDAVAILYCDVVTNLDLSSLVHSRRDPAADVILCAGGLGPRVLEVDANQRLVGWREHGKSGVRQLPFSCIQLASASGLGRLLDDGYEVGDSLFDLYGRALDCGRLSAEVVNASPQAWWDIGTWDGLRAATDALSRTPALMPASFWELRQSSVSDATNDRRAGSGW